MKSSATKRRLARLRQVRVSTGFVYIIMILIALVMLFPIMWIVFSSFKRLIEFSAYPPSLLPSHLSFGNYREVFEHSQILLYLRNTLVLVVGNTFGTLLASSLVAYPLARLTFKGKNFIFALIIGTMLMPAYVTIVPQFILFSKLGWLNTFLPLIVPAFFAYPYNIFLFRQFYRTIPRELDEAARIDGASEWQIYARIIVPLSKPIFITIGILSSVFWWNEFFLPMVFINSEALKPISVGVFSFARTMFTLRWDLLMAMSTIMIAPPLLLYVAGRRHITEGIKSTGLK